MLRVQSLKKKKKKKKKKRKCLKGLMGEGRLVS